MTCPFILTWISSHLSFNFISAKGALHRNNNFQAVKIFGSGAAGISSGQALAIVEEIAGRSLPGTPASSEPPRRSRKNAQAAPPASRCAWPY